MLGGHTGLQDRLRFEICAVRCIMTGRFDVSKKVVEVHVVDALNEDA